jgi:hypothetical protein
VTIFLLVVVIVAQFYSHVTLSQKIKQLDRDIALALAGLRRGG